MDRQGLVRNHVPEIGKLANTLIGPSDDQYQKKLYEETVTWLRESFELGKGRYSIGHRNQV